MGDISGNDFQVWKEVYQTRAAGHKRFPAVLFIPARICTFTSVPLANGPHRRIGPRLMQTLYFILVAVHILAVVATGILWTILDLWPGASLKRSFRDIRAVHFGSLYLTPWFLGLAFAFERLHVPPLHQLVFPVGLGLLVLFSGIGYLFPLPPGVDPFYYWTRGWGLVFSMIGLAFLVVALIWTAVILILYAI
jgi:hypothetical protein